MISLRCEAMDNSADAGQICEPRVETSELAQNCRPDITPLRRTAVHKVVIDGRFLIELKPTRRYDKTVVATLLDGDVSPARLFKRLGAVNGQYPKAVVVGPRHKRFVIAHHTISLSLLLARVLVDEPPGGCAGDDGALDSEDVLVTGGECAEICQRRARGRPVEDVTHGDDAPRAEDVGGEGGVEARPGGGGADADEGDVWGGPEDVAQVEAAVGREGEGFEGEGYACVLLGAEGGVWGAAWEGEGGCWRVGGER